MATIEQRLRRIEATVGHSAGRMIFVTGGETTDAEFGAFLRSKGIVATDRDLVFRTIYETKPGSIEAPMPLRLSDVSMAGDRRSVV